MVPNAAGRYTASPRSAFSRFTPRGPTTPTISYHAALPVLESVGNRTRRPIGSCVLEHTFHERRVDDRDPRAFLLRVGPLEIATLEDRGPEGIKEVHVDTRQSCPAQRCILRTFDTVQLVWSRPVLHARKDVTHGHALYSRFPLERSDELALGRRELHPQSIGSAAVRAGIHGGPCALRQAKFHRQVLRRRDTRRTIRRLQIRGVTRDRERHPDRRDGYGDISHHQRTGQSTKANARTATDVLRDRTPRDGDRWHDAGHRRADGRERERTQRRLARQA